MKYLVIFALIATVVAAVTGRTVFEIQPRISNGEIAQPGQFPYHVLFKIDDDYNYNWCGGVLISDQFILTTAECLEIGQPRKAYLGATNITTLLTDPEVVRIALTPENYFYSPNNGQLGLVKIEKKFKLSDNIQPVSLPGLSLTQDYLENKIGVLTGFGVPKMIARHADTSKDLRYVSVPVISQDKCLQKYPEFVTDNHFCTSSAGGKSFCFGDHGGPLVIKDSNDVNTVVGIAFAEGFFCGEDDWPGVYLRVTSYLQWISAVTGIKIRN